VINAAIGGDDAKGDVVGELAALRPFVFGSP
jgi:hypothetical protein